MAPTMTLGLLAERLQTAQAGIDEIRSEIKTVTDQALDRRLSKLEDTVRWLTRTVAATIISAIGSVVFALIIAGGK